MVRKAAVAGTWYPGTAPALAAAVDRHLATATRDVKGELVALIAPHAGLMYSGPVAAHAYRLLRDRRFDVAVLGGPSHFVGFDGVAAYPSGGFETPLGVARIDEAVAADFVRASAVLRGRRTLLVASTDLSHYHDAETAARLDAAVLDCVARFDADGLQRALEAR